MMEDALIGRHALVTGAGSGIGKAVALALAKAGARVTLAGRRAEPLEAVAAELSAARAFVASGFDVTSPVAIANGLDAARAALGPIDVLINNAGEAASASFEKTDLELWSHILATNLTSVFQVTQAVLPDLKARGAGARIVNIASTAGLLGYRYVSAYCAAKHGVIGLTRALAAELVKSGVTVNAVCPGYTDTPLVDRAAATIAAKTSLTTEAARASMAAMNPMGRMVTPEEVADAVLWVVSPGAAAITGQAIAVAGGEVMVG